MGKIKLTVHISDEKTKVGNIHDEDIYKLIVAEDKIWEGISMLGEVDRRLGNHLSDTTIELLSGEIWERIFDKTGFSNEDYFVQSHGVGTDGEVYVDIERH